MVAGQGQDRLIDHDHGQLGIGHGIASRIGQSDVDGCLSAGLQLAVNRHHFKRQGPLQRRNAQIEPAGGIGRPVRNAGEGLALVAGARRGAH